MSVGLKCSLDCMIVFPYCVQKVNVDICWNGLQYNSLPSKFALLFLKFSVNQVPVIFVATQASSFEIS